MKTATSYQVNPSGGRSYRNAQAELQSRIFDQHKKGKLTYGDFKVRFLDAEKLTDEEAQVELAELEGVPLSGQAIRS